MAAIALVRDTLCRASWLTGVCCGKRYVDVLFLSVAENMPWMFLCIVFALHVHIIFEKQEHMYIYNINTHKIVKHISQTIERT